MLIGEDFEKVEWSLFGLDLVEPNAFIGDTALLILALIVAFKVKKMGSVPFFKYWFLFFVVFGVGFFFGGLGHSCYNYWGVSGKYASWYSGIVSIHLLELAMISIYPTQNGRRNFKLISQIKMVVALLGATAVFVFVDLKPDPSIGLKVPSLNTLIGLVLCTGVLGVKYMRDYSKNFKYHVISVFVLIPTAVVQTLKISFAPLFDRNDISHIFLALAIVLYYLGVKGYAKYLANNR